MTFFLKSCKLIFDLLNIAPFFIFFRSLCTVVVQMDCRIVCLKPPFYYMQLFFSLENVQMDVERTEQGEQFKFMIRELESTRPFVDATP